MVASESTGSSFSYFYMKTDFLPESIYPSSEKILRGTAAFSNENIYISGTFLMSLIANSRRYTNSPGSEMVLFRILMNLFMADIVMALDVCIVS